MNMTSIHCRTPTLGAYGRTIAKLRRAVGRPGPAVVSAEGRLGLSPLPFVLKATKGRRRVVFSPPALTDTENREALAARLAPLAGRSTGHSADLTRSWSEMIRALPAMAPLLLVIDEPAGITAVNRRFWRDLGEAWHVVRRSGQRVHLVFSCREQGLGRQLNRPDSPLRSPAAHLGAAEPNPVTAVPAEPGTHYDLAGAFPRWRGRDLLLGWSLFGGLPRSWAAVPESGRRSPAAALRRALAERADEWVSGPLAMLQRGVGKPNRYASILRAVASGARSRRELSEPSFRETGNRGAAGPYLSRLREMGLVTADRPLGAGAAGRRSRYRLTDPREVFWWSVVHPLRSELLVPGQEDRLWGQTVAPALEQALARALPVICRNFFRFGSEKVFGSRARRVAPLWGPGFDFPAAATLWNGAVCYGHVHAGPKPAPVAALAALERQLRATRYGFGRQARVRVLFSLAGFADELRREAVRSPLVRLVGADELAELEGLSPPVSAPP